MNDVSTMSDKERYPVDLAQRLDALTTERLTRAVPKNTRDAYRTATDTFIAWCLEHELPALPAPEVALTRYVSHLITLGRAPATISQHIGAVRAHHRRAGHHGQPSTDRAADLLRGYRRDLAEDGVGQRQALPVTPEALGMMVATLDLNTLRGRRDQLALVLGFLGMFRRSELVRLRAADVTITTEGVTLLVRTSKTDHDSRGRVVPIPRQTELSVEPVTLAESWLSILGDDGHLLRRVTRADELTATQWSAESVNDLVRRAARKAKLPSADKYTAHSLRAGGLTTALRNGVPAGIAARHGGWDPESPVVARYARVADMWRDNAMKGVL